MLWGCISWRGMGKLVKLEGKVNSQKYLDMLDEYLDPSVEVMGLGDRWIFQQDNAPIHVSKLAKAWFSRNEVNVLKDWPSQSPNLNPIEPVWGLLKKAVHKRHPRNLKQLWQYCQEEWQRL